MANDALDLHDEIVSSVVDLGLQHIGTARPESAEQIACEQMFDEYLAIGRLLAVYGLLRVLQRHARILRS